MKYRLNPFIALALVFITSSSLQAATLYWNANSGTPDYSGAWDTATNNWNTATAAAGTQTIWTAAEDADFDVAQPYTVTVDTPQTATNLNFKAGAVTLSGTNTVSSNNLTIATGATLTADSNRFLKVGTTTLTVNGTLTQTAAVSANSQRVVLAGGNGGIVFSGGLRTGGNFDFAGNISGTGSILTDAGGTFTLSGNNTFTGELLLRSANILRIGSATALSPNSFIRTGGGCVFELTTMDFSKEIALSGAGKMRVGNTADVAASAFGFAAVNADRNVALTGTVLWGSTTFNPNAFNLGTAASTHKVTLTTDLDLNGGTRSVNSTDVAAAVESEISGIISNSSATASILSKGGSGYLLVSGTIDDSAAGTIGLTAAGGTLRISGPLSYRGNVIVSGGNLLANRNDILGSGAGITTCSGSNNQGTLQFDASGGDLSFPENITLQLRASVVNNNISSMKPNFNNVAGNTTLTGLINTTTGGAVAKISSDAGLLTISNELRGSGNSPTVSTRVSTLQGAALGLISGTITQAAGISHRIDKMGSGTWTFSNAANTFSGGIRVNEGTLEVTGFGNGGAAGVLGAASNAAGNLLINGGTLKYSGAGETSDRLFTVGAAGGTIDASGAGNLVLGNTGAITSADGGAVGLQFTFPTGSTTLAANDQSDLSPGMEVSGYSGIESGTKIVSINHSTGLMTVDTATTVASGAVLGNGSASGVIDRVLTLTGSNAGANEIAGSLADAANLGKLAITKTGTGKWVLSGTNTYTGSTSVLTGTLALVGGSHASPITVNSGAALGFTLGAPTTSTNSVTFNGATAKVTVTGTPAAATLMTASSITGTPVLDPAIPGFELAIEGSGTLLNLKASSGGSFTTWATTINGLSGGGATATADPDNDGLDNAVEFVIGGQPNPANPNANSSALAPTLSTDASNLIFTFRRTDLSLTQPGIVITAEYGSNLTAWTPAINGVNGVAIVVTNDIETGVDQVQVSIPKTLATGAKMFARLTVGIP